MPSMIGAPLGLTLPVDGADIDVWGPILNTVAQALIDAVEGGVSSEVGLTVTAALPFAGYNATDLGAIVMRDKTVAYSTAGAAYLRDGEWYLNDGSGNQIKMTSGGGINAAGVAGIGGDYGGADPAAVTYNAANSRYDATSDPGVYAAWQVGTLKLVGATSGNVLTVKAPDTLAAAYTLTLPAAVPATSGSVLVSTTGGVTSFTAAPSFTSITTSEAEARHGNRVELYGAWHVKGYTTGVNPGVTHRAEGNCVEPGTSDVLVFPIDVPTGSRIVAVAVYALCASGGISIGLYKDVATTDTTPAIVGSSQAAVASASRQAIVGGAYTETVTTGIYYIKISGTTAGDRIYGGYVAYDRP